MAWLNGWRLLFIAVAIVVVAVGLSPFVTSQTHDAVLFGLFCVPANSIIPISHEPGVIYFSRYVPSMPLALAGAAGTFVAAFLDGVLVHWLFRRRAAQAVRNARSWQLVTRMLMRAPFPTIAAVAFTGFPPLQMARMLALSADYPVHRYALATAVGRLPRFYLIALLGAFFAPPTWLVAIITLAFLAWPVVLILRARRMHLIAENEDLVEVQPALAAEAVEVVAHAVIHEERR